MSYNRILWIAIFVKDLGLLKDETRGMTTAITLSLLLALLLTVSFAVLVQIFAFEQFDGDEGPPPGGGAMGGGYGGGGDYGDI